MLILLVIVIVIKCRRSSQRKTNYEPNTSIFNPESFIQFPDEVSHDQEAPEMKEVSVTISGSREYTNVNVSLLTGRGCVLNLPDQGRQQVYCDTGSSTSNEEQSSSDSSENSSMELCGQNLHSAQREDTVPDKQPHRLSVPDDSDLELSIKSDSPPVSV